MTPMVSGWYFDWQTIGKISHGDRLTRLIFNWYCCSCNVIKCQRKHSRCWTTWTTTTTTKIPLEFGLLDDQLGLTTKKKRIPLRTKLSNWSQKRLSWKPGDRISSRMVSSTTARRAPSTTIPMDTFSDIARQYPTPGPTPTHIPTIFYSRTAFAVHVAILLTFT